MEFIHFLLLLNSFPSKRKFFIACQIQASEFLWELKRKPTTKTFYIKINFIPFAIQKAPVFTIYHILCFVLNIPLFSYMQTTAPPAGYQPSCSIFAVSSFNLILGGYFLTYPSNFITTFILSFANLCATISAISRIEQ